MDKKWKLRTSQVRKELLETREYMRERELMVEKEDESGEVEGFGHCPSRFGWTGCVLSPKL